MRLAPITLAALLGFTACAPRVRVTVLEAPLEAGVPAPFQSERATRWDFGDGAPLVEGARVQHAFPAAGRYEVRGFDGAALVERVTAEVAPRAVFHVVPPDAELAVVVRTLDELAPAVDFLERLAGAQATQRILERWPAVGFAVDAATRGEGSLDRQEGAAIFTWPERALEVSCVGVKDDGAAAQAFATWLGAHGWQDAGAAGGLRRFTSEAAELDVFVNRGTLYAVVAPGTERDPSAQARVAAMDARGLEADGPAAAAVDGLPAGGVALVARAAPGSPWSLLTLAVKVQRDRASLAGRAHARGPLWSSPAVSARRLLTQAPAGPIAVASAALSPGALLSLAGVGRGTPRFREWADVLNAEGVDLEAGLGAFRGAVDAVAYFDVPGFVRSTLASGGRPEPELSLLLEAPVQASAALERLVSVQVTRGLEAVRRQADAGTTLWRGRWRGRPVDVALSTEALFLQAGAAVDERDSQDLSATLQRRFEGAFGPGHVSLFLDVGQLRRELMTPRLMKDVDPRRALMAQALAVTFLEQLTQLDSIMVDAVPDGQGAALSALVTLRAREQ